MEMKKIFSLLALSSFALLALFGCKVEELSTDQYSGSEVKLVSFGPNPVMRGGALTFYGSNLDKIVEVEVPGVAAITDIEVVTAGNPAEIRVKLPADGTTVGKITLRTADGKTLETQSELSYIEPIVIESFSPANAMPGDVVSIKGDYMNLVASVEFAGGTLVEVEAGSTRYLAKVKVPATAVTGTFILHDYSTPANLIYAADPLTIGDPTVSSINAATPKPGEKAVVSGKYLNMIKTLTFEGGVEVAAEDFTLNAENTSLTVLIPATAQSGDVVLTDYAGKDFTAGSVTMTKPSALAVSPLPVKAGAELTVSGKDLDIVTAVNFPGAAAAGFAYADGKITVPEVPATATEGDLNLEMANGESADVAFTLVHPVIASVSPASLKAGEDITVKGTDLDLVSSAKLGGKEITVKSVSADGSELVLTTLNTSVSGTLELSLANGEKIADATAITLTYDALIIVNSMNPSAHIGEIVTLKGENFMLIENIYVGETKVKAYAKRAADEIQFIMPWMSAPATYSVYFDLLSGDRETCPQTIDVGLELDIKTIWEGSVHVGNWDGSMNALSWDGFDWSTVSAGTSLNIYVTPDMQEGWSQMRVANGSWVALPETTDPYNLDESISVVSIVLTQTILDALVGQGGLVLCGAWWTVTKVDLVKEISQQVTVWEGSLETGDYANNLEIGGEDDWVNAGMKEGATVYIYFQAADWSEWSLQTFDGHWTALNAAPDGTNHFEDPDAQANGYVSFKAVGAIYEAMTSHQYWGSAMIVQGKNLTVTKLAFQNP